LDGDPVPCSAWEFAGAQSLVPTGEADFSVLITGSVDITAAALTFKRITDLSEIGIESGVYDPSSVTSRRNETLSARGGNESAVLAYQRIARSR